MVNDEPWFRAKDVAAALGYANPHQAIRHNVDERDRSQLKDLMVLTGSTISECVESPEYHEGAQVFISETGLYSLIMSSQKTEAKAFQRWVTSEVLPSIRKSGRYTVSPQIANKRVELEIIEIDERIKSSKRRCIEEGILSMQRCGLAIDDRDKMRAKDCLNQITFGAIQNVADDNEICIRGFLSEKGIRNPTLDSKLGKWQNSYICKIILITFSKRSKYTPMDNCCMQMSGKKP
ncbi:MAG: BRO-N domain-containing protein [Flavobacteriaceae bacterium]